MNEIHCKIYGLDKNAYIIEELLVRYTLSYCNCIYGPNLTTCIFYIFLDIIGPSIFQSL